MSLKYKSLQAPQYPDSEYYLVQYAGDAKIDKFTPVAQDRSTRGGTGEGGTAPAPRILYAPAAGSVDMEAGGVSGQRFTYGCI